MPKTASISIRNACPKYVHIDDVKNNKRHVYASYWRDQHPQIFNNSFKFAITRNPYDKLVSGFLFVNKRNLPIHKYVINKYGKDFRSYVLNFKNDFSKSIADLDTVTMQQYKWLTDSDNNIIVDYVGKFEDLEKHWKTICSKCKFPYHKLPRSNTNPHNHFSTFYNQELADIVYDEFQLDFELFGYDRESWK